MEKFDIIIVGAGPGGYVAAIRAAQLGFKTAIIEKEHLGGICLNWGCIPTKALLKSSEIAHLLSHLEDYGFSAKDIKPNFKKIIERSRGVSNQLTQGIAFLLKKNKVTVIEGAAKLLGNHQVQVNGSKTYEAPHIILATGARARILPDIKIDGKNIWTYKHALSPEKQPESLIVLGSGAIGVEFASFYHHMGTKVTILEAQSRILPVEDHDISKAAHESFKKQGIVIETNITIKNIKNLKDSVSVTYSLNGQQKTLEAESLLLAIGVVGNTENLGLEKTKVKVEKGRILTNAWSETDEKGVYAIGDVASAPWLAHKASHEGTLCIEKIKGLPHLKPLDRDNIPGCTYARPQIASVGLTEEKAKAANYKIKIGMFPLMANGKAVASGQTEGFIKTIFDEKTGALLGAHMIGAEVTEMIQGFVIAKTLETTEAELMHTIFPHPTLSESMHESVLDAYNHALHFMR
jgi:dihydrolipoamide dehydrogenase